MRALSSLPDEGKEARRLICPFLGKRGGVRKGNLSSFRRERAAEGEEKDQEGEVARLSPINAGKERGEKFLRVYLEGGKNLGERENGSSIISISLGEEVEHIFFSPPERGEKIAL